MLAFIRVAKVMVSLYSAITLRKTGVGPREQGIAVAGLTVLFAGAIWTLDYETGCTLYMGLNEPYY